MLELSEKEKHALDELFIRLYDKLRDVARRVRWQSTNPTLNATALVNEAYIKLSKRSSGLEAGAYEESIAIFARIMREILIDASRRKKCQKRAAVEVPAGHILPIEDALSVAELVADLRTGNSRQGQIVDCRFYLGLTLAETASVLGISASTVEREWAHAKEYLEKRLRHDEEKA